MNKSSSQHDFYPGQLKEMRMKAITPNPPCEDFQKRETDPSREMGTKNSSLKKVNKRKSERKNSRSYGSTQNTI